eukprot:GILJ01007864.1.p1 GENE.GILJ01007864.1~~GILJ01007864.1.p1  ORF type:complete len:357 (+),score=25.33 GILJ01007864.1:160-1230(+)
MRSSRSIRSYERSPVRAVSRRTSKKFLRLKPDRLSRQTISTAESWNCEDWSDLESCSSSENSVVSYASKSASCESVKEVTRQVTMPPVSREISRDVSRSSSVRAAPDDDTPRSVGYWLWQMEQRQADPVVQNEEVFEQEHECAVPTPPSSRSSVHDDDSEIEELTLPSRSPFRHDRDIHSVLYSPSISPASLSRESSSSAIVLRQPPAGIMAVALRTVDMSLALAKQSVHESMSIARSTVEGSMALAKMTVDGALDIAKKTTGGVIGFTMKTVDGAFCIARETIHGVFRTFLGRRPPVGRVLYLCTPSSSSSSFSGVIYVEAKRKKSSLHKAGEEVLLRCGSLASLAKGNLAESVC